MRIKPSARGETGPVWNSSPVSLYFFTMHLDPAASALLATLDAMSAGTLTYRIDVGTLLQLGSSAGREQVLDTLSFHAKFVSQAHDIMKRIGKDAEGYRALEQEFGRSLQDAASLLRDLVGGASEEEKEHFAVTYFSVSHKGLDNLLALLRDLRWYKNWRIDTGRRRSDQA